MASVTRHGDRWRAHVRRQGAPSQSRIFDTKREAERWARDQEARIDRGERVTPAVRVTFGEMLTAYRTNVVGRMGRSKDQALAHIEELLGEYRLAELKPKTFLTFAGKREQEGAGPTTILIDLSYVGTVLRHAAVLLEADEAAARARVSLETARVMLRHSGRVGASMQRDRRPTDAELGQLRRYWEEHPPRELPMWDVTCFAIATAMRVSEITSLLWSDYDLHARTIIIRDRKDPRYKVGNHQKVPLLVGHTTILGKLVDPNAILMARPNLGEAVFPHSPHSIGTLFGRAVDACRIPDLRFHDLRHDGTSRLFEAGYPIEQVAVVTGHKTWANLKRYTNIRPESLHRS
jgi:integrase